MIWIFLLWLLRKLSILHIIIRHLPFFSVEYLIVYFVLFKKTGLLVLHMFWILILYYVNPKYLLPSVWVDISTVFTVSWGTEVLNAFSLLLFMVNTPCESLAYPKIRVSYVDSSRVWCSVPFTSGAQEWSLMFVSGVVGGGTLSHLHIHFQY